MSVVFADEGPGEDENVENDAKTVENAESGDQADEGALEVQLCVANHQKGHDVAWKYQHSQFTFS